MSAYELFTGEGSLLISIFACVVSLIFDVLHCSLHPSFFSLSFAFLQFHVSMTYNTAMLNAVAEIDSGF